MTVTAETGESHWTGNPMVDAMKQRRTWGTRFGGTRNDGDSESASLNDEREGGQAARACGRKRRKLLKERQGSVRGGGTPGKFTQP